MILGYIHGFLTLSSTRSNLVGFQHSLLLLGVSGPGIQYPNDTLASIVLWWLWIHSLVVSMCVRIFSLDPVTARARWTVETSSTLDLNSPQPCWMEIKLFKPTGLRHFPRVCFGPSQWFRISLYPLKLTQSSLAVSCLLTWKSWNVENTFMHWSLSCFTVDDPFYF